MIISIALQKGGTGKSTTAQTIASILGTKKKSVLLLDMDSQANVTYSSGTTPEHTVTDVLSEDCSIEDAITHCNHYDLIGSDNYLANLEHLDIETDILSDVLKDIKSKYDFIIIDTPPLLGNILKSCLYASDYVIIPLDPRPFALNGLDAFYETFSTMQTYNKKLKVLGLLLTRYNSRTILNREIADLLKEKADMFNTIVFNNYVRDGIAVPEAQTVGQDLIDYAPRSNPCKDYINVTEEILSLLKGVK